MRTQHATSDKRLPIDLLPRLDALGQMLQSHSAAVEAARTALPDIDVAAGKVAAALGSGKTLYYAAAGSSGLMAMADACELPGTFGVPSTQIRICMAGGIPTDANMPGDTEDGLDTAAEAAAHVARGDVALVVSASGTTPFALAFAKAAQSSGATVVGIANVANSALLELADVAIALPTAPEVIEGSTRLGAGTVQKVALNMISTQAGILLGHVHDGMMVNLNPDNIKLRKRASDIVQTIAEVPEDAAVAALNAAQFDTKMAVLVARGLDSNAARSALDSHGGRLADCLRSLETRTTQKSINT